MTQTNIESQVTDAEQEARARRLEDVETELEAAAAELGRTTIAYEQAKYARDRACGLHTKAMSMKELFLAEKDVRS